ncbi:hypothetical protein TVAG_449710 [Trichomonas vaginalis G3]|uniref:Uncharacterized protein n=1 Tax=Trichomonas vaginalis (strain ATCC PRA-98 / G3) TaxID=412133 RepID=A2F4B5_TRIV3|nr:SWIB/MDM2 domain family [Trichomonas vaginalis G3]EAY00235.1 hypothetical protein TVAG_449710 [Trichomonas vaginalis G3]KAI5536790.1 SWIB/MDM2 domain family [Trichomonas vaginalis G3]|eukprot:XP_001313164.1 hypothetical protein [Trichomonas vaginalis G3]
MTNSPSECSLFHEIFATNWVKDDPEFAEELKHYESAIKRLMAVDIDLTTFIKEQPVLDSDQLSSIPVIESIGKTTIIAEIRIAESGAGAIFQIYSTNIPLGAIFKSITLESGQQIRTATDTDLSKEFLEISIPFTQATKVKCAWENPMVRLSPALSKVMQTQVALPGMVSLKILSHIEAKHLVNNGEIKSDPFLKSIFNLDVIKMENLGQLINSNLTPMEPLTFDLQFPSSRKAFSIHFPVMSNESSGQFRPIQVDVAPIKDPLLEAYRCKEQICAADAFLDNPHAFAENEVLLESRLTDVPELYSSTFLYDQPWVLKASEDYLKTQNYKVRAQKK